MSGIVHAAAALAVIAWWSAAIIVSLWRGRWIVPALAALAAVLATIVAAQAVAGRWPVFYGVMLGASLFLAAAMVVMGLIALLAERLAAREGR